VVGLSLPNLEDRPSWADELNSQAPEAVKELNYQVVKSREEQSP